MIAKTRRNYKPDHGHWTTLLVTLVALRAAAQFGWCWLVCSMFKHGEPPVAGAAQFLRNGEMK